MTFWSLAAYLQLIQHSVVLATPHQYVYIVIVGSGVETSCVHNKIKQTAPVAGHLNIRWDIAPDCVIDVTGSIKTLRIPFNFNWDKID